MTMTNQNTSKAKNVDYTAPAIILLIVCLAALFLPVNYLNSRFLLQKKMPLLLFFSAFGAEDKILGFLPTLVNAKSVLGIASSLSLWAFIGGTLAAIVLAAIAIFKKERAQCLLQTALFVFTWAVTLYSLSVLIITSYLNTVKITLDIVTFLLAIVGAVAYFLLMLKKNKRSAWLLAGQFFLILFAAAALFLGMTLRGQAISHMIRRDKVKYALLIAACGIFAVLGVTSLLTISHNIWTACMQLIATITMLIIAVCIAMLAYSVNMNSLFVPALAAVTLSAFALLLNILSFYIVKKNEEEALAAAYLGNVEEEEYLEVIAYDPANAKMATEVATAAEEAQTEEAAAEIADDPAKDKLFEGKDDPFIATLSKAEKYEFADLFILKTKGNLGGVPSYEVGADNKAFFKKVFIYLSQFRPKISAELLAKISDYSENN